MQTTSPVTIKDGQVCGFIRTEDIDEATFSIDGAAASPEQTAKLRAQIIAVFEKGIFGHEICTAYVPDGDGFIAKATIDGVAQPKMDQRVIWVAPKDGYRVGR